MAPQSPRDHSMQLGGSVALHDRAGSSASLAPSVFSRLGAAVGHNRRTGAREDAALRLAAVLATQQLLVSSLESRHEQLTACLVKVNAQLCSVQQPATSCGGAATHMSIREQQAFMAEVRARTAAAQRRLDAAMHAEAHHDAAGYTAAALKQASMSAGAAAPPSVQRMLKGHAGVVARTRLAVEAARRHALVGDSRASLLAAQTRAVLAERQEAARREEAAVQRQQRAQRRASLLARHNLVAGEPGGPHGGPHPPSWNMAAAAAVLVGLGAGT